MCSRPWSKLDEQLAVERFGDPEQRVDSRRPRASLQSRDRGLRRVGELCQLSLGEATRPALLGDCSGDRGVEPPFVVHVLEAFPQVLEGALANRGFMARVLHSRYR